MFHTVYEFVLLYGKQNKNVSISRKKSDKKQIDKFYAK